ADGAFLLWASGGAVQLAAAGPGGSRVEGPRLTLGERGSQEGVTIELGQELVFEGRVRVDGAPRDGVSLYLLDGRSQKVVGAATSEGGGGFRFSGVSPGGYLVQAGLGSTSAQRGPFDFTGEPGLVFEVELDSKRALFGRVTPKAAGVIVRWRSGEWAGEATAQVTTDDQGLFRFEGVPEGLLTVEAEGEAGTAQAKASAGTEVVLSLRRGALAGLVVNEQGHAVTDFTVRLSPLGGGATRSYPVLSPSGDFRVNAPPGSYQVTATASGYGEAERPQQVELGAGEPFVKLTLLGSIEVRGEVREARDGSPVPGVEVVFNRMGRDRRRWAGRWATVLTEGDGSFEVGSVPTDAVLAFRKKGYLPLWTTIESLPRDPSGFLMVPLRRGDPGAGGGYEPYEGIGAQLAEAGGKIVVAFAFEGSPAETAGLLPGDQIVSVDGQPAAGVPMPELIRRIMGPAGTVVRMGLVRGGQPLEVAIRRRAIQF
ncbi:MAG: carboxypeptidase regulatory-like domain-containing protein, partial [Myxococcaceae bacterium]